jgi:SAM-dependent methyltransferase
MPVARDDFQFSITDEQFSYLSIQRGGISDLRGDRKAWEAAYHDAIFETYASIVPFLPAECASLLDVGSGLGGIDVVLNRHYGGDVAVYPLDGLDDEARCIKHAKTFNSARVTREFQRANGVNEFCYYTPQTLEPLVPFDLIVSFGSYCFHYSPDVYLNFIKACCKPSTILIFEVRRKNEEWFDILATDFKRIGTAAVYEKFERVAYAVR